MSVSIDTNDLYFDTNEERMEFIGELMDCLSGEDIKIILEEQEYPPKEETNDADILMNIHNIFFEEGLDFSRILGNMLRVKSILSEWRRGK